MAGTCQAHGGATLFATNDRPINAAASSCLKATTRSSPDGMVTERADRTHMCCERGANDGDKMKALIRS